MQLKRFVANARDAVLRSGTTWREASGSGCTAAWPVQGSSWQLSANRNHYRRRIVRCRWFQRQLLALSIWLSPLSHQEQCSCVCSQLSECSDARRTVTQADPLLPRLMILACLKSCRRRRRWTACVGIAVV